RYAGQSRISFSKGWPARFECDSQVETVYGREADVCHVQVPGERRIGAILQRCDRFLDAGADERIETDDGVLGRQLVVRHLDRAVLVQHRLKSIDCGDPGEVLDTRRGLADVPRDDDTVRELLHVASPRHSWLHEHADCRLRVEELARRDLELIESAYLHAPAAAARTQRALLARCPAARGEKPRVPFSRSNMFARPRTSSFSSKTTRSPRVVIVPID